jgi:hypothetical protein
MKNYMKFTSEYNWYTSYVDTDMLWLEDAMNWDDAFELVTSEYNVFGILTAAFFLNTHHYLDSLVKLSTLDLLFIYEVDSDLKPNRLFTRMAWDYSVSFSNLFFYLPLLFYSDFQDLVTTITYYSPELIFGTRDSISTYWLNPAVGHTPAASFDTFQDSTGTTNSDATDYLSSFPHFVFYVLMLAGITRVVSIANAVDAYISRAYYYLYAISTEVRFQFEAGLQAFFFVFLYTSMMIATFDDDQEELLEFFNTMCFYFFLFTLVYYFYKYSIHYFSFLEAAKRDTKASSPFSQFLFDALNIIAFALRFLVLMARLNIYDGVDDVLDSYYIFMADFEEEEYFSDAFFSLFSVMSFDTDVNDDRSFLFEDEMDFSADLFTIYFIVWGKLAYFWLFILEEIARVSLALYVTYLVLFEINAVNRSYSEDNYLLVKRSN